MQKRKKGDSLPGAFAEQNFTGGIRNFIAPRGVRVRRCRKNQGVERCQYSGIADFGAAYRQRIFDNK